MIIFSARLFNLGQGAVDLFRIWIVNSDFIRIFRVFRRRTQFHFRVSLREMGVDQIFQLSPRSPKPVFSFNDMNLPSTCQFDRHCVCDDVVKSKVDNIDEQLLCATCLEVCFTTSIGRQLIRSSLKQRERGIMSLIIPRIGVI